MAPTSRVNTARLDGPNVDSYFKSSCLCVHLSENGAFTKKERFASIHNDVIEVGFPISMWFVSLKISLTKQSTHILLIL
jgi:hypothetical protein